MSGMMGWSMKSTPRMYGRLDVRNGEKGGGSSQLYAEMVTSHGGMVGLYGRRASQRLAAAGILMG